MNERKHTLLDLVEAGFKKNTTNIATATKREGMWLETSCGDFREQIRRFALGLHDIGVRKGDRVVLHSENSTEWVIADLAILSVGAVNVPIYTTQPGDQIKYIIEDAGAKVFIVSSDQLFAALQPHLDQLPELQTIGLRGVYHPDMLAFKHMLDKGRAVKAEQPDLFAALRSAIGPDDLATLIYTSGTTGLPKGVMLSHNNIASNVLAALDRNPFDVDGNRGKKLLSFLPLSHVFERMMTYLYLHIGFPIYYIAHYEGILEDFQSVRPVHFTTVPRLLEKIYLGVRTKAEALSGPKRKLVHWALDLAESYDVEKPLSFSQRTQFRLADRLVFSKFREIFGGNLVAITSGGAALSPKIMNFVNAIGIFCGQGYGMSETSPVITTYVKGQLRAGSVGTPIKDVEVRIANDGEILVRGPNVMQGYWNAPDKTAEVLEPDGWLHTGDIGYLDHDGHLFITDRKKALFKLSTGKYVAPQPIETRLSASPYFEQVVVVGNGQKFCAALIVPNYDALRAYLEARGASIPSDALVEHEAVHKLLQEAIDAANADLPKWEQVKKFQLLHQPLSVEGGELTPTLKIKRRVVHEKYAPLIDAMYD